MSRKRIASGPVAFFDILGYESINSSNEIDEVAQIILDHLDGIPTSIHDLRKDYFRSIGLEKHADKFAKSISIILLSDSILLMERELKRWDAGEKLVNWLFFIHACYTLMNRMLDRDLLLRGAVGYGSYFRKGNCFAGKSIIDSKILADSLELAGCVFVPEAWDEVEKVMAAGGLDRLGIANFIRSITFKYEAPLKACTSEHVKPNVMICFGARDNLVKKVCGAFTSYKRPWDEKLTSKRDNTVRMIQALNREP